MKNKSIFYFILSQKNDGFKFLFQCMGNSSSSTNEKSVTNTPLTTTIDEIAAEYAFSLNISTLSKLASPEYQDYCNRLTFVTRDLLENQVTSIQLKQITDRIQNGSSSVVFVTPENSKNIKSIMTTSGESGRESSGTQNAPQCSSIARFYIKIAHLYAAIVRTLNPLYRPKNISGSNLPESVESNTLKGSHKRTLLELIDGKEHHNLDNYVAVSLSANFCDTRISNLTGNNDFFQDGKFSQDKNYQLYPEFCRANDVSLESRGGMHSGLKELSALYDEKLGINDVPETKARELETLFHAIDTNNQEVIDKCKNGSLKPTAIDGDSDKLLNAYATHIENMKKGKTENLRSIMGVLDKLFMKRIVQDSEGSNDTRIVIHPELTETILDGIIVETRKDIAEMYRFCETAYIEGIHIFEKILLRERDRELEEVQEEIQEKLSDLEGRKGSP